MSRAGSAGIVAGAALAPAFGAAVAVGAMMSLSAVQGATAARLPLPELIPLAGEVWLYALAFAYPAGAAFLVLWLVTRGLGALGAGIAGALAGFAAMAVYLRRVHEGGWMWALADGRDVATLTLPEAPGAFAMPLTGIIAGIAGAALFSLLAGRR
ncbi:hypothetical protein F1654_03870 [Alkalicaulis satelles]|uniref:Uncharacterized protein n=1 Tax=Alkalicaulis satelles TaxID=2609175 RepID=A0A5M6ZJY9_9PROT|nr:hypothetical protein [Alkalicaulis satelles]KAA5805133.1 hypothetical protein F1654_03870 [Alkalicaulis satelles]